ncbi:MAG: hydroxysqualene dehydroxylase HpnE [Bryobacteraceae bacterium]
MARAAVIGGGLAGLAAAAALGEAGYGVDVFEARPFLGGRAASYPIDGEIIDNCQHILLRCCTNLLNFYRRLGVEQCVRFYREYTFIEPGGRASTLRRSLGSFARLEFLNAREKLAVARAMLALRRERTRRTDLDRISMLDWLLQKRQPARAIDRFWRQVLVSALNEDLDRMAARHGFQVFWLGFLASANAYEMGVPTVPLSDLYDPARWKQAPAIALHTRAPVERIEVVDGVVRGLRVAGETHSADVYVSAVPFERLSALAPETGIPADLLAYSPITGIHLWFDRPVMNLPHATLLGRTIQWVFNKHEGRYLLLVVSASRDLLPMSRADVLAIAQYELREFFPAACEAKLEKAHVVKEARATFSAAPNTEALRPGPQSAVRNLFLAGDWTRSGWPPTMEGAVRSGYLAAEAITGRSFCV